MVVLGAVSEAMSAFALHACWLVVRAIEGDVSQSLAVVALERPGLDDYSVWMMVQGDWHTLVHVLVVDLFALCEETHVRGRLVVMALVVRRASVNPCCSRAFLTTELHKQRRLLNSLVILL